MNQGGRERQQTDDELAAIVQELYGPLLLYARQLCQLPEDVVQEAFLELQKRQRPVGMATELPTHLRAWLFRTVRHRALNCQRGQQRRQHYEADYSQQKSWFSPTGGHSKLEMEEAVAALQGLPDELRETVTARLWGNLTLEEIAELTDTSIATAQRRYIRGIEQLKQRLNRDERLPQPVPRKQS